MHHWDTRHPPIAITGVAFRVPNVASGAGLAPGMWETLDGGRDVVGDGAFPASRRAGLWHTASPDAPYFTGNWFSGEDVSSFDAAFFGVRPVDAVAIEPEQRMFSEVAWHAIEDAGLAGSVRGSKLGMFVGHSFNTYDKVLTKEVRRNAATTHGCHSPFVAGRPPFMFDMHGEASMVCTGCSSSLLAIHHACRALQAGDVSAAVTGGAHLDLLPVSDKGALWNRIGIAAEGVKCRPFGAEAGGICKGEGVAALVLMRLEDALAGGHHVYGVIRGSASNHDGYSNGIAAPNPDAQGDLLRESCAAAGITPAELSYIEAHGTGTALGDPLEELGIRKGCDGLAMPPGSIPVGSIKGNIGHAADGAAGTFGVIKSLFCLAKDMLPPSVGCTPRNPDIDWATSPVRVVAERESFPRPEGADRVVGVAAFGFTGTNVHLIISDPPAVEVPPPLWCPATTGPAVIALTALTPQSLASLCEALAAFMESHPAVDVYQLAHTVSVRRGGIRGAHTGRGAHAGPVCRGVVFGNDAESVRSRLCALATEVRAGVPPEPAAALRAGHGWAAVACVEGHRGMRHVRHDAVFTSFLRGEQVEWHVFYDGGMLPVVPGVPGTVFVKQRFWPVEDRLVETARSPPGGELLPRAVPDGAAGKSVGTSAPHAARHGAAPHVVGTVGHRLADVLNAAGKVDADSALFVEWETHSTRKLYEMGVDSVGISRLQTAVEQEFGVVLPQQDFLLGDPTLGSLTEKLVALLPTVQPTPHTTPPPMPAPAPMPTRQRQPLAAPVAAAGHFSIPDAAAEVVTAYHLDPTRTTANIANGLHLRGPLDAGKLCKALDATLARHDPLRLRFHMDAQGGVSASLAPAPPTAALVASPAAMLPPAPLPHGFRAALASGPVMHFSGLAQGEGWLADLHTALGLPPPSLAARVASACVEALKATVAQAAREVPAAAPHPDTQAWLAAGCVAPPPPSASGLPMFAMPLVCTAQLVAFAELCDGAPGGLAAVRSSAVAALGYSSGLAAAAAVAVASTDCDLVVVAADVVRALVWVGARAMETAPPPTGPAMLSVRGVPVAAVKAHVAAAGASLAATCSPSACVVSGTPAQLAAVSRDLEPTPAAMRPLPVTLPLHWAGHRAAVDAVVSDGHRLLIGAVVCTAAAQDATRIPVLGSSAAMPVDSPAAWLRWLAASVLHDAVAWPSVLSTVAASYPTAPFVDFGPNAGHGIGAVLAEYAADRGVDVACCHPGSLAAPPLKDASLQAVVDAARQRAFSLDSEPPVRVALVANSPQDHFLLVAVHHAVFDGTSHWLFYKEVWDRYREVTVPAAVDNVFLAWGAAEAAAAAGSPAALPALVEARLAATQFWKERAVTVTTVPGDRSRLEVPSRSGGQVDHHLPGSVADGIAAAAAGLCATPFHVTLATLAVVLHGLTGGTDDATVGVSTTGRGGHPSLESAIGMFVRVVPVAVPVAAATRFGGVVEAAKAATLAATAHSSVAAGEVPAPPVLLAFHNTERLLGDDGRPPELSVQRVAPRHTTARGDLYVDVLRERRTTRGDDLCVRVEYNADAYTHAFAEALTATLAGALQRVASLGADRVADLPPGGVLAGAVVPPARLPGRGPHAGSPSVVDMFAAAAAAANPADVAVACAGGDTPYRELAADVAHLAAALASDARVGAGDAVGVLVADSNPRGAAVAVLAVLAAGGAVVPLDSCAPLAALADTCSGANVAALVSEVACLRAAGRLAWHPGCRRLSAVFLVDGCADGLVEPASTIMNAEVWDSMAQDVEDAGDACAGWESSFTGQQLSAEDMEAFKDNIASRVMEAAGGTPPRVLEIGSASCLTLSAVAGSASRYVATDMSPAMVAQAAAYAADHGLTQVEAVPAAAHEVGGALAGQQFDVIVINSVVQYFPGVLYLEDVLQQCSALLADDGCVVLGDVIDADKLPAFMADLRAHNGAHPTHHPKVDWDGELAVARATLTAVAGRAGFTTNVFDKVASAVDNELVRYRFDAVLRATSGSVVHAAAGPAHWPPIAWSTVTAGGGTPALPAPPVSPSAPAIVLPDASWSHGDVAAVLGVLAEEYGCAPGGAASSTTWLHPVSALPSAGFTAALGALLLPLTLGGTAVVPACGLGAPPAALAADVATTSARGRLLCATPPAVHAACRLSHSFRGVVVGGGAPMRHTALNAMAAASLLPGFHAWVEGSVCHQPAAVPCFLVACHPPGAFPLPADVVQGCGKVAAPARVSGRVLDAEGKDAPVGVWGRLVVGGHNCGAARVLPNGDVHSPGAARRLADAVAAGLVAASPLPIRAAAGFVDGPDGAPIVAAVVEAVEPAAARVAPPQASLPPANLLSFPPVALRAAPTQLSFALDGSLTPRQVAHAVGVAVCAYGAQSEAGVLVSGVDGSLAGAAVSMAGGGLEWAPVAAAPVGVPVVLEAGAPTPPGAEGVVVTLDAACRGGHFSLAGGVLDPKAAAVLVATFAAAAGRLATGGDVCAVQGDHEASTFRGQSTVSPPAVLPDAIAKVVASTPDAVATTCAGVDATYAQVWQKAVQVAGDLQAAGVGAGCHVSVLVDRGPYLPSAMLGVWLAGAVTVPLPPSLPDARLQECMAAAAVKAALVSPAHTHRVAGVPAVVCDMFAAPLPVGAEVATAPPAASPAVVLFTSGSTGVPKGASLTHGGLANVAAWMLDTVGLRAGDSVVACTSIGFDMATCELLSPLAAGCRVVVADDEEAADYAALGKLLDAEDLAMATMTPFRWRMVLNAGHGQRAARGGERRSPVALVVGEPFGCELTGALAAAGWRTWNGYGPTECTVFAAGLFLEPSDQVLVGQPVDNTVVSLVAASGGPVPMGAAGEVVIAGAGVGLGYCAAGGVAPAGGYGSHHGLPGRTYATGDLGRWVPHPRDPTQRALQVLGRKDAQMKVRGARLEAGEVEACMTSAGATAAVAVVIHSDTLAVVCTPASVSVATLRAAAVEALPPWGVPSHVIAVDALPQLAVSGKVDRGATRQVAAHHVAAAGTRTGTVDASMRWWRACLAPADIPGVVGAVSALPESPAALRSALQRAANQRPAPADGSELGRMAVVWASVLGVPAVGADDDFFHTLGGDSKLVVSLCSALQAEGWAVTVRQVFKRRTIRALVADDHRGAGTAAAAATSPPGGAFTPHYVVSDFFGLQPENPSNYVLPQLLRVTGPGTRLNADRFLRTVRGVVSRHDALRCSFAAETAGGGVVARVQPAAATPLPHASVEVEFGAAAPPSDADLIATPAVVEFVKSLEGTLDVAAGVLVAVGFISVGPWQYVLLVGHHLAVNLRSWGVIVEEITRLYTTWAAKPDASVVAVLGAPPPSCQAVVGSKPPPRALPGSPPPLVDTASWRYGAAALADRRMPAVGRPGLAALLAAACVGAGTALDRPTVVAEVEVADADDARFVGYVPARGAVEVPCDQAGAVVAVEAALQGTLARYASRPHLSVSHMGEVRRGGAAPVVAACTPWPLLMVHEIRARRFHRGPADEPRASPLEVFTWFDAGVLHAACLWDDAFGDGFGVEVLNGVAAALGGEHQSEATPSWAAAAIQAVVPGGAVDMEATLAQLGGTSTTAVQLTQAFNVHLGLTPPLGVAAWGAPVREVLAAVEATATRAPKRVPAPTGAPVPATAAEKRMVLCHERHPASQAYVESIVMGVEPGTPVSRAWEALDAVLDAHPGLRGRFVEVDSRMVHGEPHPVGDVPHVVLPPASAAQCAAAVPVALTPGVPWCAVAVCCAGSHATAVVLRVSHALCDGHAMDAVRQALAGALAGTGCRGDVATSALAVVAGEEGAYLASPQAEADRAFWEDALSNLPSSGLLPPAFEAALTTAPPEAQATSTVWAALAAPPQGVCVTPYQFYAASFLVALSRMTHATAAATTVALSVRPAQCPPGAVLHAVNTAVATLSMPPSDTPVAQFLEEAAASLAAQHAAGALPFDRVALQWMQQHGAPLSAPLFNFVTTSAASMSFPVPQSHGQAALDVTVVLCPRTQAASVAVTVLAATPLAEANAALACIVDTVGGLQAAAASGAVVGDALRAPVAQAHALHAFERGMGYGKPTPIPAAVAPPGCTPAPVPNSALHLFLAVARRSPAAPALIAGRNTMMSFQDVSLAVDDLAATIARGVGDARGQAVVCAASRDGPWMPITLLACWRLGAAMVLSAPNVLPQLPAVLSSPVAPVALVTDLGEGVVDVGRRAGVAVVVPGEGVVCPAGGGAGETTLLPDTAYVCMTSGTTSAPKACQVSHKNLRCMSRGWAVDYCLPGSPVVVAQWAPHSFDVAMGDVARSWLCGVAGTLVLVGATERKDPAAVARVIAAHRATFWETTPHFGALAVGQDADSLASLAILVLGSDLLRCAAFTKVRQALRGAPTRVINSYGMSEATVDSCFFEAEPGARVATATGSVPIGRPMTGVRMAVLDMQGGVAPVGCVGSLVLAGAAVGLGNGANADLPDGTPALVTGDRARWLPDGNLEFLGRLDRGAKVRGCRVDAAALENMVMEVAGEHLGDQMVHVAVHRPHPEATAMLLLYVADSARGVMAPVPAPPAPLPSVDQLPVPPVGTLVAASDALGGLLRGHLPPHLLPHVIVPVAAMPVSGNGKLAVGRLPAPGDVLREWQVGVGGDAGGGPEGATAAVVASTWEATLGFPLHPTRGFLEQATSLQLMEFLSALGKALGRQLAVADVFSAANFAGLVAMLDAPAAPIPCPPPPAAPTLAPGGGVAIVGVSVRLPGGVTSLADLHAACVKGSPRFAPFPRARVVDALECAPAALAAHLQGLETFQGSFLEDVATFDAQQFNIAAAEAASMSPEQRLALEASASAAADAGLLPHWSNSDTAVFTVGTPSGYGDLLPPTALSALPGNMASVMASRVSYTYNLGGKAVAVDAACASGLDALQQAVDELRLGRCSTAVVAGASVLLYPGREGPYGGVGTLAPSVCKPFDASGDGMSVGEGALAFVLMPAEVAVAQGRHVYATIRGTAVNNSGRASSVTAPNPAAQAACMRAAMAAAGVTPDDIDVVEAHGTGTPLGDAAELGALCAVFGGGQRGAAVPIGSIKSVFGHLDACAGLLGVAAIVAGMQSHTLLPTAGVSTPHPAADASAVDVLTSPRPWPADRRRLAVVTSIGLSGTNANVVLEAGPSGASRGCPPGAPLLLTARSVGHMAATAAAWLHYVDTVVPAAPWGVADVCRASLETPYLHDALRIAFVGLDTVGSLRDALAAVKAACDGVVPSHDATTDVHLLAESPVFAGYPGATVWGASLRPGEGPDWVKAPHGGPAVADAACGVARLPGWVPPPLPAAWVQCHGRRYWAPRQVAAGGCAGMAVGSTGDTTALAASIMGAALGRVRELVRPLQLAPPPGLAPALLRFCNAVILRVLHDMLPADVQPGWRGAQGDLFAATGSKAKFERLFNVMVRSLVEGGVLVRDAGGTVAVADAWGAMEDPGPLAAAGADAFPAYADQFRFPLAVAPSLVDVMQGRENPVDVIYPDGQMDWVESQFVRLGDRLGDVYYSAYWQALCTYAVELVARLPAGRRLRVLEVGAGMGLVTRQVVAGLAAVIPAHRLEYWYTDYGPAFVNRARTVTFPRSEFPFMEYEVLDVTKAPGPQGVPENHFDIVISYNVVHTTHSIRAGLNCLKEALAPDGKLFLVESCKNETWSTLAWGVLDGWWLFQDTDLRPEDPMLEPEVWRAVLAEVGFRDVLVCPQAGEEVAHVEKFLFLCGIGEEAGPPGRAAALDGANVAIAGGSQWFDTWQQRVDEAQAAELARRRVLGDAAEEGGGSAVRRSLHRMWCRLLGRTEAIPDSGQFLELGGASLLLAELRADIKQTFGVTISMTDFFAYPTLGELTAHVEAAQAVEGPGGDFVVVGGGMALTFPGQGVQMAGMCAVDGSVTPATEALLAVAAGTTLPSGRTVLEAAAAGPATIVETQACVLTASVMAWTQSGSPEADVVAGLSVGELAALVAAGVLEFAGAMWLVVERATAMEAAAAEAPGGMLSLRGLSEEAAAEALAGTGVLVSNVLAPGVLLVSGPLAGLDALVVNPPPGATFRRVPGLMAAFHHATIMAPAATAFQAAIGAALAEGLFHPPVVDVVLNTAVGCQLLPAGCKPAEVANVFAAGSVSAAVHWTSIGQAVRERLGGGGILRHCGPGRDTVQLLQRQVVAEGTVPSYEFQIATAAGVSLLE